MKLLQGLVSVSLPFKKLYTPPKHATFGDIRQFQPYLSCFGSVTPSKVIPLGQAECSHLCSPEFSMCMSSLLPYVEVWPPPLQKLHRSCFSIKPMVDELFPLHASIGASMACSSLERSIPYPSDSCCFINPALVVSCDENIFCVVVF